MYFLKAALSGMKRRLVASLLAVLGGSALLTAAAAIGLWSLWLMGQQDHIKAARSASVFIDSAEPTVVEEALTRVMQVRGVETARIVSPEEASCWRRPSPARSASVFIDSAEPTVVEEALTRVMQVRGVETARIVSPEEFQAFLKQHFPDLHEALASLGDEVVPRMLEVVFPVDGDAFARREAVDSITKVPNIVRVDDGSMRLGKALNSLRWLGYGGACLAIGLWVVLFIVCLGHYQNILYTDAQEIQLIRSFGATKAEIILPWLIEAVVQSAAIATLCVSVLFVGRAYLSELYNQFFGTIGYDAFHIDLANFTMAAGAILGMALVAHVLAGMLALIRGRIA